MIQRFIIRFKGGLGNQMFIYAFYCSLKARYPHAVYMFDTYNARQQHQGYELMRIFHLKHKFNIVIFKLYQFIFHDYETKMTIIQQSTFCTYDPILLDVKKQSVLFDGFWQSYLFFNDIAEHIKKQFAFKEALLNAMTKDCLANVVSRNSVSIHIRRGDYLSFGVDMENRMNYYNDAINYIKKKVNNPYWIFFSDDPQWVKEHFLIDDGFFVHWNSGEDSWQDMFLMSKCKHNIIANSTFSWWGAWLNNNPDKIVIAPTIWFDSESDDIVPSCWIRL